VRDAVCSSGAAHGNGNVPGFRPVVYLGKDVRVNVDHDRRNTGNAPGAAPKFDLSRFVGKEEGAFSALSADFLSALGDKL
jgi:hypothetical protein